MKKLLFLLTMSISLTALSQNWELFPLGQKSYFIYQPNPFYNYGDLFLMDSVRVNGQDTILLFRRNLNLQGAGTCYVDTLQSMQWNSYNWYYIDSLVQRNDSIFYYNNLYSTTPFYFLPNATVGQSWTVASTWSENDYNQITITCSSIQVQTFLGITDSVKTFTLTPNGTSFNQIPVNNFTMRLSKSHGLVEYVPFILFLSHEQNVNFFSMKLIGIDSTGITHGYHQPKFSDYFHLSAGDILAWERHYNPAWIMYPQWWEYYRDSITQVSINPDSVIYTFDRTKEDSGHIVTQQFGLINKFTRAEFGNIIETAPNWVGIGNNRFAGFFGGWSNGGVLYWSSSLLNIKIDSISGDTITSFSFSDDASSIDTNNCQLQQTFDVFFNFAVDTRRGVTEYCYYNFDEDCVTLKGSLISGILTGDITLSTVELNSYINSSLKLFPNPATNVIYLDNIPAGNNLNCEIYNCFGELEMRGIIVNKSFSINELSDGLYFIRIFTEKGSVIKKFVKK